ncbi:MAG: InlB B-repeat-containing protein, partial [Bacilli bacterium]|nr:InlB B-repeat-containing protein [Bacilli bacterium]
MNISIKKIGILVLFMVSIFILSGCEFLTSQSTITSIEVEATTLEDSYDIDTFELSSISIKVSFSDGKFQSIPITEAMLSNEHLALLASVGEHEIIITYEGKTTSVTLLLNYVGVKAQLMTIYNLAATQGGFTGTYEEWLESIQGEDGLDIKSALINNEGHLILTLSDDSTIDAGKVVPEDAKEVEFQTSETHIQWRHVGDETWVDLITLESLKGLKGDAGVDGKEVELQTSETHIQWRYVGEETWVDLVLLSSLIGPKGEQGISITDTAINELGELVVTYSDDTTKNLGAVVRIYLVSFKDDNGYVLDSQLVLHGSSATAPSAPSKEGYTFKSWDKEFTNVTSNLEVKAT